MWRFAITAMLTRLEGAKGLMSILKSWCFVNNSDITQVNTVSQRYFLETKQIEGF